MTNMASDHSSDQNEILADFIDEAQRLQTLTDANPDRGWDYELGLGAWLFKICDQYGAPTDRHHALDSALRSV